MGLPSAWTAAAALPITSSSNGSGAVSSTRRSTSKPTRTWPRRGKVSPPTSSSTTTNDCTRRWLTAPRARSSTKQRHLPIRRGGKTLARAQHYQHNEMQTWAGFPTLGSPDHCLEDRVHLKDIASAPAPVSGAQIAGKVLRQLTLKVGQLCRRLIPFT